MMSPDGPPAWIKGYHFVTIARATPTEENRVLIRRHRGRRPFIPSCYKSELIGRFEIGCACCDRCQPLGRQAIVGHGLPFPSPGRNF